MITCVGCNSDTLSESTRYQTCQQCELKVHVIDEESYFIPVFDISKSPALSRWTGFGPNLLHELNREKPYGYLQTRIHVVLEMTETTYKSGKKYRETLWRNLNRKLAGYGLKVVPFNPKWEDIENLKKEDFLQTPCFLQLLNLHQPEILLPSNPVQSFCHQKEKSSISANWMKEKLLKMYPEQTLSVYQNEGISHSIENTGSLTSIVIPTGSGKTRIAQSLAVSLRNGHGNDQLKEGPIIVLYPTISLMDDQKKEWQEKLNRDLLRAGLNQLNIRVLHSNEDEDERNAVNTDLLEGKIDILLCSPEQLVPSKNRMSLMEIAMRLKGDCLGKPFSALIVDEVHIVFDWGDSIREAFLLLPQMENMLKTINPQLRTVLMTATLTPREENDLLFNQLGRNENSVKKIRNAEVRTDLAFTLINDKDKELKTIAGDVYTEYASDHKWRKHPHNSKSPLLMYSFRPDDCEQIAIHLKSRIGRKRIETYTGQTQGAQRKKKLARFQNDEISLMVATSAFGMGVNKSNVWMTAYLGQPATLRELYQAFGRTARGSNWSNEEKKKRNGNCIARIVRRPMRGYAPTFGPSKALERLIPMILKGEITSNGYALLSLNPEHQIYWNPYDERYSRTHKDTIEAENKYRDILTRRGVSTSRIPSEIDAWWSNRWNLKIRNRMNAEYKKRRKATIYLEKAGVLKIHGFFPENPLISENFGSLHEILEIGGIERLIKAYSEIGWESGTMYNSQSKQYYLIAEIQEGIESISDLFSQMERGIQITEKWANENLAELSEFLKEKDQCIRTRFLPVVGGNKNNSEVMSCEERFNHHQHFPLPKGEMPVAPCSVCRQKIWGDTDPLFAPNSNLKFNGKAPHSVWLEHETLEYLAGRLKSDVEVYDEKINGNMKQLPIDGFLCGFAFDPNEKNLHSDAIKQKWFELCKFQRSIQSNSISIKFDKAYDGKGKELPNEIPNSILVKLLAQQVVIEIDLSGLDQGSYPFGGLIYLVENEILCRMIGSVNDAREAYKTLTSKLTDQHSNIQDRFIGKYRPDQNGGNTKREW